MFNELKRACVLGVGLQALESLTDDQLSDPANYLGLHFLFWASESYNQYAFDDLMLNVIRRLPYQQLVDPILDPHGQRPDFCSPYIGEAISFLRVAMSRKVPQESHIKALFEILLDTDYRQALLSEAALSFCYNPNNLRVIVEQTALPEDEIISYFLNSTCMQDHVGPDLSSYGLDILERHLTVEQALTLLHRQIQLGNTRADVVPRLLRMVSPASLLATSKISVPASRKPVSALWRTCAKRNTEFLKELLPLLTQEEVELQNEDGSTILIAVCENHQPAPDMITAICDVTSREFRFIRNHKGHTALDLVRITTRADHKNYSFYTRMLSPTPINS